MEYLEIEIDDPAVYFYQTGVLDIRQIHRARRGLPVYVREFQRSLTIYQLIKMKEMQNGS